MVYSLTRGPLGGGGGYYGLFINTGSIGGGGYYGLFINTGSIGGGGGVLWFIH